MFALIFLFSVVLVFLLSVVAFWIIVKDRQVIISTIKKKITLKNVCLGIPVIIFALWTMFVMIHGWFVGGSLLNLHPIHGYVLIMVTPIIAMIGLIKGFKNESFRKISIHCLMALVAIGVMVFSQSIIEWLLNI